MNIESRAKLNAGKLLVQETWELQELSGVQCHLDSALQYHVRQPHHQWHWQQQLRLAMLYSFPGIHSNSVTFMRHVAGNFSTKKGMS